MSTLEQALAALHAGDAIGLDGDVVRTAGAWLATRRQV